MTSGLNAQRVMTMIILGRSLVMSALLLVLAACAQAAPSAPPPSAALSASIALGRAVIENPQKYLPHNVTADMSCAACHLGAGSVPRGGTFVGTYARFPQWNKRAKRVITLQDRLAECFLYSMNGTPPAYTSKEMIGMVAYIAYLSRGVPTGATQAKSDGFIVPLPAASPDLAHGQSLYAQKCSACHQPNGAGIHGAFPPLWGPKSFNNGAGMAHIDRMTGWVMFNMPQNAPGTLSLQEAYDIAGWVLTHPRPRFVPSRLISQPAQRADFF